MSSTLFSLIFCFNFFIFGRKKARGIEHYEEMRDKLVLKEKEKVIKEESPTYEENYYNNEIDLTSLATGFVTMGIMVAIGLTLLKEINTQIGINQQTNFSQELINTTILGGNITIIPSLFFIIGFFIIIWRIIVVTAE